MKRAIAWLASSLLVFNAAWTAGAPLALADMDESTGLLFFTLPFGDADLASSQPSYGFRVERAPIEAEEHDPLSRSFAPGELVLPPLFELRFEDEGLSSLSFAGVNTLPLLNDRRSFHGDHPGAETEHYLMIGAGLAGFVLLCIFTFCDSDDGGGGGGDPP